jgi:adenylate cyclase class 2
MEMNTFMDTPGGDLFKSGSGLRVRRASDLRTGNTRAVITHKGPKKTGPLKVRPETEVRVDGYEDAVELLRQLGYEVKMSFEKRRETWELGDCEIVLDELPEDLGTFVEIEGGSEESVKAMRTKLGLDMAQVEEMTYAIIVREHLEHGGRTELIFG